MLVVAAHLAKLLEDPGLVLRRDPDASVSYRDLHSTVTLYCVNSDPASLRSELHRIGQQVKKDLLDLALVADEIPETLVDSTSTVMPCRRGALADKGASIVYG